MGLLREVTHERGDLRPRAPWLEGPAADGLVTNAAGRRVPTVVNGREQVPFQGVGAYAPEGAKHGPPIRSVRDYPASGDKRVPDLKTALQKAGLRDGMTISSHHHFRNGDRVALMALQAAAEMGVKGLRWFPSASFEVHAPVIELMEQGVVHHIEGSMNGPWASSRPGAAWRGWACSAPTAAAGRPCRTARSTSTSP
jgi:hypothetical protein